MRIDKAAQRVVEHNLVLAGCLRDAARHATGERYGIQVCFGCAIAGARNIDKAARFVNTRNTFNHPFTLRELAQRRTIGGVQVEVLEAIALGGPY